LYLVTQAATFCTEALSIFSTFIAIFPLHKEMYISTHALGT